MSLRPGVRPLSFNIDVLLNIMNFSEASTICQLMRISRELYHHGPKLLISPIVMLESERALKSFILFLSAEAPYRVKFLKGISMSIGALSAPVAQLLVDFLHRFGSMIKLDILHVADAEAFFDSSPKLPVAFAALAHIDELELVGVDLTTSRMLRSAQATFNRVVLCMTEIPPQDEDEEDDEGGVYQPDGDVLGGNHDIRRYRNPIYLLRNSQATLNDLTVDWCITGSPPNVLYTERYPHLTTLNLLDNELPQTHHYARAFPNLASLLVKTDPKEIKRLNALPDAFDLHRAKNESLQLRHGSWNALERVNGTLMDLYLLGLSCLVKQLLITPTASNDIDVPMFHAVMTPAQPAYIHVDMVDVSVLYNGSFGEAMSGPSVAALRSLDLSLAPALHVPPAEIDISLALDMLIDTIRGLSLHTLGLHICCTGLQFPILNENRPDLKSAQSYFTRDPLWPAEAQLLALDFAELACRIRAAAPPIRTVVLSLAGHRVRPSGVLVVGEEDARALGDGAVEAIPLRLVGELQKAWTEAAESIKVVTQATARATSGELAKELERMIAGM